MRTKITKRSAESAKAETGTAFLWDREVRGFGLKTTPTGHKVYLLQYRHRGRVRRYTIGAHGSPWTPESARQEALRLLVEVASGSDPAERKARRSGGATVAELCARYMTDHAKRYNAETTVRRVTYLVEKQIKPALGTRKVEDVTRADVIRFHEQRKGTPRQANIALTILSKMFNLAEVWGLRPEHSNPVRLVRRFAENKRERFLSEDELGRLGFALTAAEQRHATRPVSLLAIRLLALSGCRLGEVLALKWEHVDPVVGALRLPSAKAGARAHPVGTEVLKLLESISSTKGSPWVFNGQRHGDHISESVVEKAWARLRKAAKLGDCRIHDLRHTVGTYSGQTGANAFLVRDKLGHKTLAMTGRYVSRDASPLRALSDVVEARIGAALSGEKPQTVVPLVRRA